MTAEITDRNTSAVNLTTANIDRKASVEDYTDQPIKISSEDHFNLKKLTLWPNRRDATYEFTLASGKSLPIYGEATSYGEDGILTIVSPAALGGHVFRIKMEVDYSR